MESPRFSRPQSTASHLFSRTRSFHHPTYKRPDSNRLDSLIQTVRIFSNDIGMKFGIEKCAVLIIKRGKVTQSEGITLPDDTNIRWLKEGEGYKYLGVLEACVMLRRQIKEKIKKEYLRRVRKVAPSKLNRGNLIQAINMWAVSLIRYAGGGGGG